MANQQIENSEAAEEQNLNNVSTSYGNTLYHKVNALAERFAATNIGQHVIERVDRVLNVIEVTARWSLPKGTDDEEWLRPLPWLLFLILIVILRLTRSWLSFAALFIGNPPVTPIDVVYFIQTRRRKLRAIRLHGLQAISSREQQSANKSGKAGIMVKVQTIFSNIICRPGQHRDTERRIFVQQQQATVRGNALMSSPEQQQAAKRPREDECLNESMTVQEMLEKFANENSEDDSDYIPNIEEEEEESSASSSDTSTSSDPADEQLIESANNEIANNKQSDTLANNGNLEHLENLLKANNVSTQVNQNGQEDNSLSDFLTDINNEVTTTASSGAEEETPKGKTNGPLIYAENHEVPLDIATPPTTMAATSRNQLNVNSDSAKRKSTPGHLSAAAAKPNLPGLGSIATAGSPPDNKHSFATVPGRQNAKPMAVNTQFEEKQQKQQQQQPQEQAAMSSVSETPIALPKQAQQKNPQQQGKQQNQYQNRNRGKNRRL